MRTFLILGIIFCTLLFFIRRNRGLTHEEAMAIIAAEANSPEGRDAEQLFRQRKYRGDDGKIYDLIHWEDYTLVDKRGNIFK